MKKSWGRILVVAALALVILAGVLYAGDWLIWSWRASHGTGYGTVEVRQFLATSLKGNKTEYDLTGTAQESCSRSIFPQQGNPACWWLERHRDQWQ